MRDTAVYCHSSSSCHIYLNTPWCVTQLSAVTVRLRVTFTSILRDAWHSCLLSQFVFVSHLRQYSVMRDTAVCCHSSSSCHIYINTPWCVTQLSTVTVRLRVTFTSILRDAWHSCLLSQFVFVSHLRQYSVMHDTWHIYINTPRYVTQLSAVTVRLHVTLTSILRDAWHSYLLSLSQFVFVSHLHQYSVMRDTAVCCHSSSTSFNCLMPVTWHNSLHTSNNDKYYS